MLELDGFAAQGAAVAEQVASQEIISSFILNESSTYSETTPKNPPDERGAKCSSDFCHAEMVTSTEFKNFLSSNVVDLRPDSWKTDFCLQKSSSFCTPSFGEERGHEAWRDLL
jgi:hypothetical protein